MTVRGLAGTYAAGLAAVLTLAACSGQATAEGPRPGATGTTTATSTATSSRTSPTPSTSRPTASATPPSTATVDPVLARIPPAARPETMEGAAAYAEFYMHQVSAAFRAADPAPLDGLSKSSCSMCSAFAQGARDLRAAGQHYGADLVNVHYATAMEFSPSKRQVFIDFEQQAVPVLNAAGAKVDTTRHAKLAFVATLSYKNRWFIDRLQNTR
ncbi:MAG TPA: DUF6318 family protein [Intrasporangium sp.]|uniref:DUF6318 family protein n=1 Tax=Intrasporangium sp. TaxID=1925024 RepID=UPI002D79995F|nr:DUF6318 family protein [Intrasporangium sp.]HET7396919.1 DUF6318 family protein [Intrasporangium sp.]